MIQSPIIINDFSDTGLNTQKLVTIIEKVIIRNLK